MWNAWAKGYKLGVQASSDHLSTHYSYAMTIAEDFTRNGLLQAMKRRHSYGATDNILLDVRLLDEYMMGDEVDRSEVERSVQAIRVSLEVPGLPWRMSEGVIVLMMVETTELYWREGPLL